MLHFFRTYQKIFYIIITAVIIISFSFFGTYSTLASNSGYDPAAFTAVDGTKVPRSELEELAAFIGTDAEDKLLYGGQWGPNFLNDGVLKKNFLETGLAALLFSEYREQIRPDLEERHGKERHYTLYEHPQARFLSVENAWNYFAPEMGKNYARLKKAKDPASDRAFNARVELFLGEKQLPAPMLSHLLRYQEKQYSWLSPDPNLPYTDLSLFGHHTFEDWFGPRLSRLAAEFIINSAIIAEKKGYSVTKEEALADLMLNNSISFQQNKQNPRLGVANSGQYFEEQLRRMGMSQTQAARIWRKVLLFRRMFEDFGNSLFLTPETFNGFNGYASESIKAEAYSLPLALRFSDDRALHKFEIYLDAVADHAKDPKEKLLLPASFKSADAVAKTAPGLVQKRFLLDIAQADKTDLEQNISLKEVWDWETERENWTKLAQEFPEIGALSTPETDGERFAALEKLDGNTRSRIDAFARKAIVGSHPEWIEEALKNGNVRTKELGISLAGGKFPLQGVKDRKKLALLLENAPLQEAFDFTEDNIHYYRIAVRDRAEGEEILTFAEARDRGVLDEMLQSALEKHYSEIRQKNSEKFKNGEDWKPLEDVYTEVAEDYFSPLSKSILQAYRAKKTEGEQNITPEKIAGLRLFGHAEMVRESLISDPGLAASLTKVPDMPPNPHELSKRPPLGDQWKLYTESHRAGRSQAEEGKINLEEAFRLDEGEWSSIAASPDGNLLFFRIASKNQESLDNSELAESAKKQLSSDAQMMLGKHLLKEMRNNNSLSLQFMNRSYTGAE